MKQPRRLLFLVAAAARAVTDPLLETAIAGGQAYVNLDIRFGPDVYRIPVGVNATCDEKRRHLQGVMPEGMLGQGCTNRACAALVTLAELLPSCAAYCEAAMGDAKLERTSTVEPGALWRGSPGGAVTSLKGQRFEAVARAFLGAHGYASAGGAAEPLAKLFEEQNRFDPKYADLGEVVLYELAHAEARVRPPTAWFDDLRTVGWHRMPGADRLSLFPESRVAQARRVLEAVTGHVRFNFLGGRGTDASTRLARGWVERFALAHFRADDVLVFTDSWQAHAPLGPFDRTLDAAQPKWNPKLANNVSFIRDAMTSPARDEWVARLMFLGRGRPPPPNAFRDVAADQLMRVDASYVATLCSSGATLAPAGDNAWSRRFYEAILCCSVPVVQRFEHAGRTDADLELGYRYHVYDPAKPASAYGYERDWATRNWHLFANHSTLLSPASVEGFECPERTFSSVPV